MVNFAMKSAEKNEKMTNSEANHSQPPLDRWRADAVLDQGRPLWGLTEISGCLGVSVDTARRWAKNPEFKLPVSRLGGRWYADRRELLAWRRAR